MSLIEGMRVVRFCHYLQGPAAAQYLADLGADVIKVEPLGGAFERHWSGGRSYVEGVSAFHLAVNRNKRSIAIDLKNAAARPVLDRMIDWADVVMENFRPGVMERNGLGYDTLKSRKPSIIFASASAYGPTGPAAKRPGQDLLMQARTGLAAVTGAPSRGPTVVGAAVIDQHGAALLAMGILAAYVRQLKTGVGTRVEASLFQAGIDLQIEAITKWFHKNVEGDALERAPNVGSWYHDAPYGPYACRDGALVLSMNDAHKLAEALDSDTLRALVGIDRYAERDRFANAVATAAVSPTFEPRSTRTTSGTNPSRPTTTLRAILKPPTMKCSSASRSGSRRPHWSTRRFATTVKCCPHGACRHASANTPEKFSARLAFPISKSALCLTPEPLEMSHDGVHCSPAGAAVSHWK